MGKGKNCVVCYREMYESMRQTVFSVIQTICKNYLYSYEELKSKLPDEIANIGPHFMEHPFVIKKELEVTDDDKAPIKRFFDEPIYLEEEKFNIVVSNQWSEYNFAEFCKVVNKEFSIEIEIVE